MTTKYIFEQHEGGFFSNFNKVVTFLTHNQPGDIAWRMQGQPYGAFAYSCGEVFSNLFKHVIINDDIDKNVQIVKEFEYLQYTGKNADVLYTENQEWRTLLNTTYNKFIHPTEKLRNRIKDVDDRFRQIDNVKIGILKRNQLLKCEQVSNNMPTAGVYKRAIENIDAKSKKLYLSVDNYSDLNFFRDSFDCIYSESMRRTSKDSDTEPHFVPGTTEDAENIFLDVYALSKCDFLVHPISNMATAALYINPYLTSIYLR
jgi:hypothetical protein